MSVFDYYMALRRIIASGLLGIVLGSTTTAIDESDALAKRRPHRTSPRRGPSIKARWINGYQAESKVTSDGAVIYYTTLSDTLDPRDIEALRTYYKSKERPRDIIIEGHADPRGTEENNLELGRKRAAGVEKYLRIFGYSGNFSVTSQGESKPAVAGESREAYSLDRRVTVIANEDPITRALKVSKADVYLVDRSSSMNDPISNGKRKIDIVRDFDFPENSIKYGFDSCSGLVEIKSKEDFGYGRCYTPLWNSLYSLVNLTPSKKSITVLTDGADTTSSYRPEDVIKAAKDRGIKINVIGIGVTDDTFGVLKSISDATQGSNYRG